MGTEIAESFHYTVHDCYIWQVFQGVASVSIIAAVDIILILRGTCLFHAATNDLMVFSVCLVQWSLGYQVVRRMSLLHGDCLHDRWPGPGHPRHSLRPELLNDRRSSVPPHIRVRIPLPHAPPLNLTLHLTILTELDQFSSKLSCSFSQSCVSVSLCALGGAESLWWS